MKYSSKTKLILRLIVSPLILLLMWVASTYHVLIKFVQYIKYGGEFAAYEHTDPETIQLIYRELVNQRKV